MQVARVVQVSARPAMLQAQLVAGNEHSHSCTAPMVLMWQLLSFLPDERIVRISEHGQTILEEHLHLY